MKLVRYYKTNHSLHIGGEHNKLSVFLPSWCGLAIRLTIGDRVFHLGDW